MNLRSKIKQVLDRVVIGHNLDEGAEINIKIGEAEKNEFARPDPE